MRVFTTLPQEDLRRVASAAREVEAEGYDGVASMENKHDPFLALAVAGAATECIELHTSVAIAFARTPMAVANVSCLSQTRLSLRIAWLRVPATIVRESRACTCRP